MISTACASKMRRMSAAALQSDRDPLHECSVAARSARAAVAAATAILLVAREAKIEPFAASVLNEIDRNASVGVDQIALDHEREALVGVREIRVIWLIQSHPQAGTASASPRDVDAHEGRDVVLLERGPNPFGS